jgi:peptidoglycan hydrolase CwlO-like protein
MSSRRRQIRLWLAVVATVALTSAGAPAPSVGVGVGAAAGASLNQLGSQLGHEQAHQQTLQGSLGSLSRLIGSLDGQITLIRSREAVVGSDLAHDRAALASAQASLVREQALLARLRVRLAHAQALLSRQLVSSYESDKPDLVTVALEARGFTDLLERLDFLRRAEGQQQTIISITRAAKAQADTAARRLVTLAASDRQITAATALRARALSGMSTLLQSRQAALGQARAAQQTALAASRARGRGLQAAISRLQAQQAAAAQAAASTTSSSGGSSSGAAGSGASSSGSGSGSGSGASVPGPSSGPALGPSGGWAIPYAIVLCESGGQNLPPNSAGASGYYQILPSTWKLFGGAGPAAYLAGKAEQDAVAARIWNGGAGASNWVCAGIVGIH